MNEKGKTKQNKRDQKKNKFTSVPRIVNFISRINCEEI